MPDETVAQLVDVNNKNEGALESPVCCNFTHDEFNTLCASWAPNFLQGELFLSRRDLYQWP
jgi:hypothetical protein